MDYSALLTLGKKRLYITLPSGINPPDIAIGNNVVVPLVNVRYTLTNAVWTPATRKYVVDIAIEDNNKFSTASNTYITTVAPSLDGNPYAPTVRNQGGYVKNPVPIYSLERMERYERTVDKNNPDLASLQAVSPQGVVVAVPVVLGAIAALLGLGLIYLTVDSIEEIVDSPAVSVFIVAIAALIFFILWKQLRQ